MQVGYVDFDAMILGVAVTQFTMGATDFLANTKVTYLNPELRGLEQGDYAWIDPEARSAYGFTGQGRHRAITSASSQRGRLGCDFQLGSP